MDAPALAYEHPSWAPDGRSIAFRKVDAERTSSIWRADVGAGETTALTHGLYALFPAWAPGGGRIVYATDSADGQRDLHIIDSRTGEHMRQITDDRVHERWPVWVDAWHIAFLPFDYADGDADRELRIVDLTGRERETIALADMGAHIEAFSWVDPARPVAAKGMDASVWANLKQRDNVP